jgi:hypothetical protein
MRGILAPWRRPEDFADMVSHAACSAGVETMSQIPEHDAPAGANGVG